MRAEEHLAALLREIAEVDIEALIREVIEGGEAALREVAG